MRSNVATPMGLDSCIASVIARARAQLSALEFANYTAPQPLCLKIVHASDSTQYFGERGRADQIETNNA